MSDTTCYAREGDLFSLIEMALASKGYTVEIPLQRSANGTIATIMNCGRACVLIGQRAGSDRVELEVWGLAPSAAIDILESLQTPSKRHRHIPKEAGETNHIERLNTTLRQWCANLVRKTLSFSKDLELHKTRIRMVIEHCNAHSDLWAAV